MAGRRGGQRFPRGGAGRYRPSTNWSRSVSTADVAVPASTKVLIATLALDNPGIAETIRRTRGVFSISADQTGAVEDQIGAMGMMVVNDLAIAAGVASLPGPVTDANDDGWFVWVPYGSRGDANFAVSALVSVQYAFDSKAMRKVEEGFGIVLVAENASGVHGHTFWDAFSLLSSRTG